MIARERRLAVGTALLTAVLAVLAGCASGHVAHTADQKSAVNGASGEAGEIAVRDAAFVFPAGEQYYYPAGSTVPLRLTIVNTGDDEDRLVGVQSQAAGSARVEGTTKVPANTSIRAIVAEQGTQVATATATAEQTTSGTATPTQSPTSGPATATSAPASGTTAPITSTPITSAPITSTPITSSASPPATPTGSELEPGELTIVLENLTEDVRPGRTVRVVLLFEKAGELVLLVPIASPEEPREE